MGERTPRTPEEEAKIFRNWMSGRTVDHLVEKAVLQGLSDEIFDYAAMYFGDGLAVAHIAKIRGISLRTAKQGVALATVRLEGVLQLVEKIRGEA